MSENPESEAEFFELKRKHLRELTQLSRAYFTELMPHDTSLRMSDDWDSRYRSLMEIAVGSAQFSLCGMRIGKEMIGFIMFGYRVETLWQAHNRGYISNIYVAPRHRRKGIGREMVQNAVARLAGSGVHLIELELYTTNEPADNFWRSFGFAPFKYRSRLILDKSFEE